MIWELVGEPRPSAKVGTDVASSSWPENIWRPNFKFGNGPLLASASIKAWAQGQGGRVAESLVHGLLLPEDVQFFLDGTKDLLARHLQWHTIVVIFYLTLIFILMHADSLFFHTDQCCNIRLPS